MLGLFSNWFGPESLHGGHGLLGVDGGAGLGGHLVEAVVGGGGRDDGGLGGDVPPGAGVGGQQVGSRVQTWLSAEGLGHEDLVIVVSGAAGAGFGQHQARVTLNKSLCSS